MSASHALQAHRAQWLHRRHLYLQPSCAEGTTCIYCQACACSSLRMWLLTRGRGPLGPGHPGCSCRCGTARWPRCGCAPHPPGGGPQPRWPPAHRGRGGERGSEGGQGSRHGWLVVCGDGGGGRQKQQAGAPSPPSHPPANPPPAASWPPRRWPPCTGWACRLCPATSQQAELVSLLLQVQRRRRWRHCHNECQGSGFEPLRTHLAMQVGTVPRLQLPQVQWGLQPCSPSPCRDVESLLLRAGRPRQAVGWG